MWGGDNCIVTNGHIIIQNYKTSYIFKIIEDINDIMRQDQDVA